MIFSERFNQTRLKGYLSLIINWSKDFQLLIYIAVMLSIFRVLQISIFSDQINEQTQFQQIFDALSLGFRFDLSTASKWVLISFLVSILCLFLPLNTLVQKFRFLIAYVFVIFSTFMLVLDIPFFTTYGDHYNNQIFGVVYDDLQAVLLTFWKEYHPLVLISIIAVITYLNLRVVKAWLSYSPSIVKNHVDIDKRHSVAFKTIIVISLFVSMLAFGRGLSFSGAPLSLKHAFIGTDMFLNRSIPNPLFALWETLKVQYAMDNSDGFARYWPGQDISLAVKAAFPERQISPKKDKHNIQNWSKNISAGLGNNKPQHIFIVLMESHSGWVLLPEYRNMKISPQLEKLADKGIYIKNFLPASSGTIGAVNALVTGLPDSGVAINYDTASSTPYITSAPEQFNRLGYKTRFFYGGLLGWQRLDSFITAQGFDEVYGTADVTRSIDNVGMNEWGVNDEYLFRFVEQSIKSDEPSFNLILTTTNHPPYDIDFTKEGVPELALSEKLKITLPRTSKVLRHLWYADKQLGRFVDNVESQYPNSLFAITGDHTARLQIKFPGDNVAEQVAVPLVLYGAQVLGDAVAASTTPGSHIDILPTLLELSAAEGIEYYSFGRNLVSRATKEPAIGYQHLVTQSHVISINAPDRLFRFPGTLEIEPPVIRFNPSEKYNALMGLAWLASKKDKRIHPGNLN